MELAHLIIVLLLNIMLLGLGFPFISTLDA